MPVTTGLSGNEIYCLNLKGYQPGNIVVGNSVHALGLLGSIGSSMRALLGGEIVGVTQLIEEGRNTAYQRMAQEGQSHNGSGITGVTSQLIYHKGNIEFLSIGSTVHADTNAGAAFSTSADGQELYAQLDAGYQPVCFAFGNVAYSMGIGRGIIGNIKTIARGEIKEFSDIFNHTRNLSLERIIKHAADNKANAVVGIQTTILPYSGINEMIMIGTASYFADLPRELNQPVITSDMTNIEMWNMAKLGYMPMRLLLGTSIYSLGLIGNITASIKSLFRLEIPELTKLIYEARENALDIINREAKAIGADDVVGVKTYVYQIGNNLVEFLAIGTAVKKIPNYAPKSEQLPPQAIVVDHDTFYDSTQAKAYNVLINQGKKPINAVIIGPLLLICIGYILYGIAKTIALLI